MWAKGTKIGTEIVFHHFLKFGYLVFLYIEQDDSLEQCLTTSRGKTNEKKLGCLILSPKLVFLTFSQVCVIGFP